MTPEDRAKIARHDPTLRDLARRTTMPDDVKGPEDQDPNLVPNVDPTLPTAAGLAPEEVPPVVDPTPPTEPTSHKPVPTTTETAFGAGEGDDDQEKMRQPRTPK
jgi:hypothetical protein